MSGAGRGATVAPAADLVLAVDTLVAGVHFPIATDPQDVAFKAMAVNASDLAAMGAEPLEAHVAARCPTDEWRAAFELGLDEAAAALALPVATLHSDRGEARATVSVIGTVPRGASLLRSGARAGDRIFVTGTLGDAGLALAWLDGRVTLGPRAAREVRERLDRPQPRLAAGRLLRGLASAAIDISDGLCQDLGHILAASEVGAVVHADALPGSTAMSQVEAELAQSLALSAGDDYEICFTVASQHVRTARRRMAEAGCLATEIGEIVARPGLTLLARDGRPVRSPRGYQHFGDDP